MKAATTEGFGSNSILVVDETRMPKVGPDDVLVEVHASSVNPKDWKLNQTISSFFPDLAGRKLHIMGDDLAGVVVDKGANVEKFAIGDAVYGMDMRPRTAACAEYAVIAQDCVAHRPANISYGEAASVPLAALTALQALYMGEVKHGSKILVIGASGGVGTFAVQIAKAMGAEVTGVCSGKNAELVKSLGADAVIDYTAVDYLDDENDFDLVFDATSYESPASCSSLMKEDGIFVTTGGHLKAYVDLLKARLIPGKQKAKRVAVRSNTRDLETLKHYIEEGKIIPVLDSEYALEDIDQAYARSKTGRARGKIVIKVKD